MPEIKAIFSDPIGGFHNLVGGLIKGVTGGAYSHAALGIELYRTEYIMEATGDHVGLVPFSVLENIDNKIIYTIPVSDEQLLAVQQEVLRIEARRPLYSKADCVAGGIADLLSDGAGEVVAGLICDDTSMDCSRLQTHLIRKAFPDYGSGMSEHIITPEDAQRLCCELLGIEYNKGVKEDE